MGPRQLVLAVESTGALGASWPVLLVEYVEKIVRCGNLACLHSREIVVSCSVSVESEVIGLRLIVASSLRNFPHLGLDCESVRD